MKRSVLAVSLFLVAVLTASCSGSAHAQAAAPVVIGQSYKVLVGMGALRFKILEIGKGGLVRVQAIEDGSFVGIQSGTTWWLNLNQALLVEAK